MPPWLPWPWSEYAAPSPTTDFDDQVDDLIRHECESSPTKAEILGQIRAYDTMLQTAPIR
jgi:hypothetical protein